jgi:hypothetical protein
VALEKLKKGVPVLLKNEIYDDGGHEELSMRVP